MNIKIISRILLLLVGCTILACLLYPLVFRLLETWGFEYSYDRIFRRIWMIAVFVGLIVFRHGIGLKHPGSVGFTLSRGGLRNFLIGVAVACLFLWGLSWLYVWMNAWAYYIEDSSEIMPRLLKGFYQGTLVALIEEYIFRGLIFFSLARRWPWFYAALFTSVIFSSLHFLEGHGEVGQIDPYTWHAGFQICGIMLSNMVGEFIWFPDALGLFCVGMILCYAAYRTGNLWYAAGLHCGWVFYTKWKGTLFYYTGVWDYFWVGGTRMFNGLIPIAAMFVIFPITYYLTKYRVVEVKEPENKE